MTTKKKQPEPLRAWKNLKVPTAIYNKFSHVAIDHDMDRQDLSGVALKHWLDNGMPGLEEAKKLKAQRTKTTPA